MKVGEAAVQVLKDVLQCLTSLRINMYMLHLVSMILSSLHPFKLQEVATIPCQLPTPAPTFSAGTRLCQHCYVALGRSALLAPFPRHESMDFKQISEAPWSLPDHTYI